MVQVVSHNQILVEMSFSRSVQMRLLGSALSEFQMIYLFIYIFIFGLTWKY